MLGAAVRWMSRVGRVGSASKTILWVCLGIGGLAVADRLTPLFSAGYLPHRYCYLAQPWLVWTNVVMDVLIALSYGAIFSCLLWIANQLRGFQQLRGYLWIFLAFGTFIVACGATHLMEVVTVWLPVYPFSALVKVICAAASVPTAVLFWRAAPALSAGIGRFIEVLSTTQQERTKAIEALIASEKLAAGGRISATLAHEIRNPLETIGGELYLIKTDPRLPEDLGRGIGNIDSALARLNEIVTNTLSLFQTGATPVPVSLDLLVAGVIDLERVRAGSDRIELLPRLRADVPFESYPVELGQILTNLLRNACSAIGQNGRVAVRVQPRRRIISGSGDGSLGQPGYSITVADTGSGIPPAYRARLFTLFFTTKGKQGTGVGLWLVRSIVEKHGGRIRFRSRTAEESTRAGTVFNLWLPLKPAPVVEPPVGAAKATSPAQLSALYPEIGLKEPFPRAIGAPAGRNHQGPV